MPGWSKDKRTRVESAFYKYLSRCWINSRDGGRVCLGANIYEGQKQVITQIFDGLEEDKHEFYILKSRQLGISTVIRALNIFWMGVFPGLKGAIVFDTDNNKTESRAELEVMIDELPASLKFPKVKTSNRAGLTLENNSKVLFMSAGVKKSKSSGTLGRSVGLAAAHGSELCSWDNDEGWEAFHESLSDSNPDRIYIWESTARGFNFWWTLWQEARNDPAHKVCIFIGWWAKDTQKIEKTHPDYALYGETVPTEKEQQRIAEVRERYGMQITPEQLAWIRRKYDPTAVREGDADPEFEASSLRMQEQPWCVVAGTKIGTDSGILPIENVKAGQFCSQGKIIAVGVTGVSEIWRIKTRLGYTFRGTANHPIITAANEEIKLEDSLGAKVRLQPPLLKGGAEHVVSWKELPATVKVSITADLARFIGLFMGDGSAGNTHRYKITEVAICCDAKDADVIGECQRLFKEVFDVEALLNPRAGWVTVRSGVKRVFTTLENLGLLRNNTGKTMRHVHVPDFIWKSPKYIIREFLIGLFEADGFNGFDTNRVALFSKYPDFISDIQLLLLAFGITSRSVTAKKKAGDGHFYTGNQLELRTAEAIKFNTDIGFISRRKSGRFDPVSYEKKWNTSRRKNRARPTIVFEDEIVEVINEKIIQPVWNVTVENSHLFDANGILTHNTEDDAFQQTGSIFFPADKLTEITHNFVSNKFNTYMFLPGAEFVDMTIMKAPNTRNIDLKVWEDPVPDGVYVMGVDPAFGENEYNDRSSIQIMRCYSDGLDQVAEYASPLINTRQLAWVIASLLGWYGSEPNSEIKYALELNGPGTAVFNELKSLRHQLESGYRQQQVEEKGLKNVFRNVRTYIWSRPDSMGVGQNYHIKTSGPLKVMFMERLRDFTTNGSLRIRSLDLVEEMKTVAREGDSISAPGSMKDDRVLAAAFAVHVWETGSRRALVTQKRSREAEIARKRLSIVDQASLFHQNQLQQFFAQKHRVRVQEYRQAIRQSWRYR